MGTPSRETRVFDPEVGPFNVCLRYLIFQPLLDDESFQFYIFFCFAIFNRWDLHFTAEYDTFYPSRRAVGGSEQVSITCPWSGIIRIGYCNHINIGKNQKKKHKHTHQLTKSSDRLWNLDGAVEIEDEFGGIVNGPSKNPM